MTLEELANVIFDDLLQIAEDEQQGSRTFTSLEEMRQKWLRKIKEVV